MAIGMQQTDMDYAIVDADIDRVLDVSLPWDRLKNAHVLVTGANGFIPAYFVDLLMRMNRAGDMDIRVTALVRNADKAAKRFARFHGERGFQILCQDVCEPVRTDAGFDYIIHAASQASPKYYRQDPVGTLRPNVIGTDHLLSLAKEHRSKGFLFFSSAEVYGAVSADAPIAESALGVLDQCNIRSCYGESKRMGETMCVSWLAQHQVPAYIVRPFHTYGPGLALDDGRVFADFVADIVHRRDILLSGDGSAVRSYCYLGDAISAYFTILFHGKPGEAYNVGNAAQSVSVLELAQRLVQLYPALNLKVARKDVGSNYMPSAINKIIPDTSKIQALGWTPFIGIEEGFRRTIDSYRVAHS